MNNKVFVVTHKHFDFKLPKIYIPIQVGRSNTKINLGYLTDENGDNISNKNANYCELTAVYWVWKNEKCDNVGIVHYRRYFVHGFLSKLIDEKYINKMLAKYDVILPVKFRTKSSVYEHFINSDSGREQDLIKLRSVLEKEAPDYLSLYDKTMESESASYCNMLVTSKKNYDEYCEWLFPILFKLEKEVDMAGYTTQEQRLFGFISEFLLNVWVEKNKKTVKYCDVLYLNGGSVKVFLKKMKIGIKSIFLWRKK